MPYPFLRVPQITAIQDVRRWHAHSTSREQSLAEHSHQVALIARYLAPDDTSAEDMLQLLDVALVHDAHETVYGDIPYPAKVLLEGEGILMDAHCRKRFWGGVDPYEYIPHHVLNILEVADRLEAALYAQKYIPEIAGEATAEAVRVAQEKLRPCGMIRALLALGIKVTEVSCVLP